MYIYIYIYICITHFLAKGHKPSSDGQLVTATKPEAPVTPRPITTLI